MFFFNLSEDASSATARSMKAWSTAFAAWNAFGAHAQAAAARSASTPLTGAMSGDATSLFDAGPATEASALYIQACSETWRAAMDSMRAFSSASDFTIDSNPFGLTGLFTSAMPNMEAFTNAMPGMEAVTKPAPATKPKAKTTAAPRAKAANDAAPTAPRAKAKTTDVTKAKGPIAKANAKEPKLLRKPRGKADDLTEIKGVGPKLAEALNELGIYHFWQIAELTKVQAEWVDDKLMFRGRIAREGWIKQARHLAGAAA